MFAFYPHRKAPDFVIANVVISIDDFMQFLDENKDNEEIIYEHEKHGMQLSLQMCEAKNGNYYFKVNSFRPSDERK